jgi:proteasome lid subunit RPN8/RPN11
MTTATIEDLKQQITRARERGETRELQRLQAEYRTHPGAVTTAAGRGHHLPQARVSGSLGRPVAASLTAPAVQGQSVAITPSVRAFLDDQFDGREQGGFLIGPIGSNGEIFVTGTIAPQHDDAQKTRESIVLDLKEAVRILDTMPADQTIVGDWHCHPHESDSEPSSADIRSWERLSQYFERPWVGLIGRNAPVWVFGRETGRFEINATLTDYSNGRASHRPIPLIERSF